MYVPIGLTVKALCFVYTFYMCFLGLLNKHPILIYVVDILTKYDVNVYFRYVGGILIVYKLILANITDIMSINSEFTLEI